MFDEEGVLKLTDFGLSGEIRPGHFNHCFTGSPLYSAPEIILTHPYIGPEVDVWSLGVLLYTTLTGTKDVKVSSNVLSALSLEWLHLKRTTQIPC